MADRTKRIVDFPTLTTPNGNTRILVSHASSSGVTNTYNLTLQRVVDTVIELDVPLANTTVPGSIKVGNNLFMSSGFLNVNLSNYVTTSNLNNSLTDYVLTTSLSNYVNSINLNANLSNYATILNLTAYATRDNLSDNLANYATVSYVDDTLANYNFTGYQTSSGLESNVATLTANNANNLGGFSSNSYVKDTDSRTLSGNLVFSYCLSTGFGDYGILKVGKFQKEFTTYENVNGNFTFDCSNGNVFYVSSACSTFTPILSNFICQSSYATEVMIFVSQSSSVISPSSNVSINDSNVSIDWIGSQPTVSANKQDVITYTIFNFNGTYKILGQTNSFG